MVEPREWLIRKDGYFYRPNCAGYTTSKFEAGRYTKAEAEREAQIEPWHMSAIHQDEWPDDPPSRAVHDKDAEIFSLTAKLAQREQELAEARAERDFARREADEIRATNSYRAIERASAAESRAAALDAQIKVMREALEFAREQMWTYGFSENDLQPIRLALRQE